MKRPLISIRRKMLLLILGTTLPIYLITLFYLGFQFRNSALREAKNTANSYAEQKAKTVEADLDKYLITFQALSTFLAQLTTLSEEERIVELRKTLAKTLQEYPEFDNIWVSWDRQKVDPNWNEPFGQRVNAFARDEAAIVEHHYNLDQEKGSNSYFYQMKKNHYTRMAEPYMLDNNDVMKALGDFKALGSSPIVPIVLDGTFLGILGADMLMDDFQHISTFDQIDNSQAMLVSHTGIIVAHRDQALINQTLDTLSYLTDEALKEIQNTLASGESISFSTNEQSDEPAYYVSFVPINFSESLRQWSIAMIIPISEMTANIDRILTIASLVGFAGMSLLTIVVFGISGSLSKSLFKSNLILRKLSAGNLEISPQELRMDRTKDMKEMSESLSVLKSELEKKAEFSRQIGQGNLSGEFKESSELDVLGASLLDMRKNLQDFINETNHVVRDAGINGNLSSRINVHDKTGAWGEMAESVNNLLRSILQPITAIGTVLNAIAEGNMLIRFEGDVAGDLKTLTNNLNAAMDRLSRILLQVELHAETVEQATTEMIEVTSEINVNTNEIATSTSEMNLGTQNQVRQVDESSTLMESIMSSSNAMSDQSSKINEAATQSAISSEEGQNLAREALSKIDDIAGFAKDASTSILGLEERSKEISRVLALIQEVAAQTNLLALNAAIEAAQAGEAGHGFSVVAQEIRKLAEDAKIQTKEIEMLVTDIKSGTRNVSEAMTIIEKSIEEGARASKASFDIYARIIEATSHTKQLSELIAEDATKQQQGISEVVRRTESVVVIAEQTAAGTEEIASSASELSVGMENYNRKVQNVAEIATELRARMSNFKLQ